MKRTDQDWFRFAEKHVKNPAILANKLCYANDAASRQFRTVLDSLVLEQIELGIAAGTSKEISTVLLGALNILLVSPKLYDPSVFENLGLKNLASASFNPEIYSIDDLARLNRQLLEASYPEEIVAYQLVPDFPIDEERATGERSAHIGTATNVWVVTGDGNTLSMGSDDPISLSEFEVGEAEIKESRSSFVYPLRYSEVKREINAQRLIWIVGPPEAGKSTLALFLAHSERPFQSVYKIKGTRAWSVISASNVKESAVLLTDAVYLVAASGADTSAGERVDEAEIEEDIDSRDEAEIDTAEVVPVTAEEHEVEMPEDSVHPLRRIMARGNTVIVTSTEDVFSKAGEDPQLSALLMEHGYQFQLTYNSYGRAERLNLIKQAINLAHKNELNSETKQWALTACAKLERKQTPSNNHPIFKEWLPGEICTFVTSILASAKSSDEIEAELKVPLNKRMHSWFMELTDESIRCFILMRCIFPHLEEGKFQTKMKEVIHKLKKTYPLELKTVSVYSYQAAPYISDSRPYQFINAHVLKAAIEVIAEHYRPPFIELCSLLMQWTVPEALDASTAGSSADSFLTKSEKDRLVRESAPLRDAVARMAGAVGRYDLKSVRELLDHWASHALGRIGQAAGIALCETARSNSGFEQALGVVEDWARKPAAETGLFQKRTAADALRRLIDLGLHPPQRERALRLLKFVAKDSNPYVRRAVAHAASQVAQAGELAKIVDLLELLAGDQKQDVRTHLALCLATARLQRAEIRTLIQKWLACNDPHLFEVGALYLLMNCERKEERILLYQALHEHPAPFKKTLGIAIKLVLRRRGGPLNLAVLRRLLTEFAGRNADDLSNQQAVLAVLDLGQRALTFHRSDVASYVAILLEEWAASPNDSLGWAACAVRYFAATTSEQRLQLLNDKVGPLVRNNDVAPRIKMAQRLNWIAAEDRVTVHQLLQDWLVSDDPNSVTTVVFYWLLVTDDSEPDRNDYLAAILRNFPLAFERALSQAVDALLPNTIKPVLQSLAFDNRAEVRRQVAMALGRSARQDISDVYGLLEDWLALDDVNAGATVVFFWLAAGDYTQEQRYENLKAIVSSFPITFDRGVREAVEFLGPDSLSPQVAQLRQSYILT